MKTTKLSGILLLFLCCIGFAGCEKDKEIYPLSFEKEYYEVPLIDNSRITVRGGNRDYKVTVEKTDILEVSVDVSSSVGMGDLVITPKQKGETLVTIKDNVTNETVDLKIKVTDAYLAYMIQESNHPALAEGVILYLINNEARDCYFFDTAMYYLITKGTYEFSLSLENGMGNNSPTYGIPYLTLNYASDAEGNFTDAAIAPTPHPLRFEMFDGVSNVDAIGYLIPKYLEIKWEDLLRTKMALPVSPPLLKTTVDDTDYVMIGTLIPTPAIPDNILD